MLHSFLIPLLPAFIYFYCKARLPLGGRQRDRDICSCYPSQFPQGGCSLQPSWEEEGLSFKQASKAPEAFPGNYSVARPSLTFSAPGLAGEQTLGRKRAVDATVLCRNVLWTAQATGQRLLCSRKSD